VIAAVTDDVEDEVGTGVWVEDDVCVKDNDGVIDGDEPKPTCKMQL
jgi:hypothetical protein